MKPEYWDKIAEFIADIIKIKNENILSLNQTLEIKNQELSNQTNQIHNLNTSLENKENLLNFQNNYGKAKTRIQNQLSYKLGQALILNSKSVLGFLSLPFIILSIVISHKQEQKAYKFKIKKNPNLALPPLETYPDYNEALKEKECFTYKLGEEFIKASKNWYGGGYIKFILKDAPRLKRECERKR
ncbi:alpha-2,3-sialyltransferase [Campylobacter jejuni]|nr:alpha-2,3-sialyltransferase [Campylobacter jejuni]